MLRSPLRNTMPAPTENRYGMYLTPEEAQNSELLRNLAAQQHMQIQQAYLYERQQSYAHGWIDPRTNYTPLMASSTDTVYKPRKIFKLPTINPYYWLVGLSILLCIIGVLYETI